MKLLGKTLLTVIVIAALAPFTVLKGPDGDTLMKFSDFGLPDLPVDLPGFQLPDVTTLAPSGKAGLQTADEFRAADESLKGKDIFYQWHDADGNIQFTSEPPPDGIEFTVKGYDPNANVIPAVDTTAVKNDSEAEPSAENKFEGGGSLNPYDADSIKKLFEDAKNIEKMLQQRYQEQSESLKP